MLKYSVFPTRIHELNIYEQHSTDNFFPLTEHRYRIYLPCIRSIQYEGYWSALTLTSQPLCFHLSQGHLLFTSLYCAAIISGTKLKSFVDADSNIP